MMLNVRVQHFSRRYGWVPTFPELQILFALFVGVWLETLQINDHELARIEGRLSQLGKGFMSLYDSPEFRADFGCRIGCRSDAEWGAEVDAELGTELGTELGVSFTHANPL